LNRCGDSLPCWEPSEWGVVTGRYLRGSERARRPTRGIAYALVVAGAALLVSDCAQGQQGPGQVSTQTTTVHGIVRVGVSGDPLPHALVRIGGDASTGVLTDGDGRFEIIVTNTGHPGAAPAKDYDRTESTGVGLSNVCQRLSARFGAHAKCEFGPLPNGGYQVHIIMPLDRSNG